MGCVLGFVSASSGASERGHVCDNGAMNTKRSPKSLCPFAAQCGACSLIGEPYETQLASKDAYVADLLHDAFPKSVAENMRVHRIVGMDRPLAYRDKIASPFAPARHGRGGTLQRGDTYGGSHGKGRGNAERGHGNGGRGSVQCGLFAQGSHRIVPVTRCAVEAPIGRTVVIAVRSLMQRFDVPAYDEDRQQGFVRHVIVRVGHATGEVLVTIVTAQEDWKYGRQFAKQLVKRVPQVTTVVQNVNSRVTNAMLGRKEHVLYGPGFILDEVCGVTFRISSKTFFQVNSRQTEVLYRTAIQMAGINDLAKDADRPLRILDAYCGSGAIGLIAAHEHPNVQVIGVESVVSAVEDAKQNAMHNGIRNARFVKADATRWISARAGEIDHAIDVVFMDPPRAGSTPAFLSAVADARPKRIVYVSCNPETQVRDIRRLVANGYAIKELTPVDMFPQTPHVETVALLSRAKDYSAL